MAKQGGRRGLFLLGAALHGDQRAQFFDELRPRAIVLQGMDEPLEFISGDRSRLGRARPRWQRKGETEQQQPEDAPHPPADANPCLAPPSPSPRSRGEGRQTKGLPGQTGSRSRISRATASALASPRRSSAAATRGRSAAGRFWLSLYLPSSRVTVMSSPMMPFSMTW